MLPTVTVCRTTIVFDIKSSLVYDCIVTVETWRYVELLYIQKVA